ncbi:hypothetical protein Trydic_g13735 [Trypoxylus dichotomus]
MALVHPEFMTKFLKSCEKVVPRSSIDVAWSIVLFPIVRRFDKACDTFDFSSIIRGIGRHSRSKQISTWKPVFVEIKEPIFKEAIVVVLLVLVDAVRNGLEDGFSSLMEELYVTEPSFCIIFPHFCGTLR